MSDEELALRSALWVRVLAVFGEQADDSRIEALVELTAGIPWRLPPMIVGEAHGDLLFARALERACLDAKGMWAPGPGDVFRAAVELGGRMPNPGQAPSERKWVRHAREALHSNTLLGLPMPTLLRIGGGE